MSEQLNTTLTNIDDRGSPWVSVTNLMGQDGNTNTSARDKIVMCVYSIVRETSAGGYQAPIAAAAPSAATASFAVVNPPLYLDVHLMFMANFSETNYGDGLAALSRVISCLQETPVLSRANTPALDPAIDKLTLEFQNLDPADVNYVMGMLGARYLPSVFYKLRMLPFTSAAMRARTYPVMGTGGGAVAA